MINTIYIENEVLDHPRSREICARFNQATIIHCERYGEVFNPKSQNFRLQKQNPALILAKKHDGFVLETPEGYGIGGKNNFYFSHMLNCIYDCRYCFLQGMYRSANYILFVNYEDFENAIDEKLNAQPSEDCWFFSGYDCDSLALEPISNFTEHFLPFFANRPNAYIELRTKSTQIRSLLKMPAISNAVVAFSFTPDNIAQALEHKAPNIHKRIESIKQLQQAGWKIGLRFDPLIYQDDYQTIYDELFDTVFSNIDNTLLHSVSLGAFRLPKTFHKNIIKLYPDEILFAGSLEENNGMVSYPHILENQMTEYCFEQLSNYTSSKQLFPCTTIANSVKSA